MTHYLLYLVTTSLTPLTFLRDSKYTHKYYIKDPNQIMPKYVLRFRVSRAKNVVKLEDTAASVATSSIAANELRYIDPVTLKTAQEILPSKDGNNNNNNNNINPLGKANDSGMDKRLVPIEKVFAQAVTDMNYLESDATTISKRQWMDKQLTIIEDKVREINLNYADIAEAIDDFAQQAKLTLQHLVREKLELCLSMEIELRRQSEQLQWLQGVVAQDLQRYQHALVDAQGNDVLRRQLMMDFLKQWKQYLLLRNGILRTKPSELQALAGVHGDVKIQGDVKVFVDPFYQHNQLLAAQALATGKKPSTAGANFDAQGNPVESGEVGNNSNNNNNNEPHLLGGDEGDIADLIQRLNSEVAGNAATTSHNYVVPAIQRVVNQEMDAIQRLVTQQIQQLTAPPVSQQPKPVASNANANTNSNSNKQVKQPVSTSSVISTSSLQLPRTILKATAMGAGGRHQPLALHSILDLLKEEADKPLPLTVLDGVTQQATTTHHHAETAAIEDNAEDRVLKEEFLNQALPAALGYETTASVVPPKTTVAPPSGLHPSSAASAHSTASSSSPSKANASPKAAKVPSETTPTKNNKQQQQQKQASLLPVASESIEMTLIQLQQFVRQYPAYALSTQSLKKQKQLQVRYASGIASDADSYKQFLSSRIILPTEVETVFFSLPIFAQPPKVKCIYSTHDHRRSMEELLSRTVKNRYPTLLVIQSGDFRFGAFLSHPPLPTCTWAGNPSCFLFSLTLDLKIPFHARHVLGDTLSSSEPCAMFVQPDRIFLGNGDLTIDNGLDHGTSELENSYGMGMDEHSVEAMCLLAGTPFFTIDNLEVWSIQTN